MFEERWELCLLFLSLSKEVYGDFEKEIILY